MTNAALSLTTEPVIDALCNVLFCRHYDSVISLHKFCPAAICDCITSEASLSSSASRCAALTSITGLAIHQDETQSDAPFTHRTLTYRTSTSTEFAGDQYSFIKAVMDPTMYAEKLTKCVKRKPAHVVQMY